MDADGKVILGSRRPARQHRPRIAFKSRRKGGLHGFIQTAVSLLFTLSLASCGLLEPKPAVNANPLAATGVKLALVKDGQHVAGTIHLSVVPDSSWAHILRAELVVDSSPVGSLTLNTTLWTQTEHVLHFTVWVTTPNSGLANLQGGVVDTFSVRLIFDQTPARAPSRLSISKINGHPELTWKENPFSTFLCYVIRRNGTAIDTVLSESSTTYVDTSYTLSDFDRVRYDVGASNFDSVAYSSSTLQYGKSLALISATGDLDNFDDRVILESNYTTLSSGFEVFWHSYIVSASTVSGSIISQVGLPQQTDVPGEAALSLDGSRIFEWQSGYAAIAVFDTNLSSIAGVTMAGGSSGHAFAVGLLDRVFWSDASGSLFVTKKDGTQLGPYAGKFDGSARFMSISPDGTMMLAADDKGIKSFTLTGDSATLRLQSPVEDRVSQFRPDWENSRVFLSRQGNSVEVWDMNTLKSTGSFPLPASVPKSSAVTALAASSTHLYAAYTLQNMNGPGGIVVEFDLVTRQPVRSWTFNSSVTSLLVSKQGQYMFACTASDQWAVGIEGGQ